MAGTGDLESMEVLTQLRMKHEAPVTYGTHCAIGCALGLLFLGGGSCTLGRRNSDIAALLMAFYPRWPTGTTDNQFYLQALRHLYALAVRDASLECIDVDSGRPVFVPIAWREAGGKERKGTSPLLLGGEVESVRLDSDKYYSVSLPAKALNSGRITFFVKRKVARADGKSDGGSGDADLATFKREVCDVKAKAEPVVPGLGTFGDFCKSTLPKVTSRGTEALHMYLSLFSSVSGGTLDPLTVANIKLCVRASEAREEELDEQRKGESEGEGGSGGDDDDDEDEGLVEGSFIQLVRENVELFFESGKGTKEGYQEWRRGDAPEA